MVNKTRKRVRRQIRNKKLDKRLNVREIMHQRMMQGILLTQPQQQTPGQLSLSNAQQDVVNKERAISNLTNKLEAVKNENKRKENEYKNVLNEYENEVQNRKQLELENKRIKSEIDDKIRLDRHYQELNETNQKLRLELQNLQNERDIYSGKSDIATKQNMNRILQISVNEKKNQVEENKIYGEKSVLDKENEILQAQIEAYDKVIESKDFTDSIEKYKEAYTTKLINDERMKLAQIQMRELAENARMQAEIDAKTEFYEKDGKGAEQLKSYSEAVQKQYAEQLKLQQDLDTAKDKDRELENYNKLREEISIEKSKINMQLTRLNARKEAMDKLVKYDKNNNYILSNAEKSILESNVKNEQEIEIMTNTLSEQQRNDVINREKKKLQLKIDYINSAEHKQQLDNIYTKMLDNEKQEEAYNLRKTLYDQFCLLKQKEREEAARRRASLAPFALTEKNYYDITTALNQQEALINQINAKENKRQETLAQIDDYTIGSKHSTDFMKKLQIALQRNRINPAYAIDYRACNQDELDAILSACYQVENDEITPIRGEMDFYYEEPDIKDAEKGRFRVETPQKPK